MTIFSGTLVFSARTRCISRTFSRGFSDLISRVGRGNINGVVAYKYDLRDDVGSLGLARGCSFVCTTMNVRPNSVSYNTATASVRGLLGRRGYVTVNRVNLSCC